MIVKHNLSAQNANRMYGLNSASFSKSTEKLSSGYRINRAADDAAGLAISEKMRRQVRGLTRASQNCQEGIGLCQTKDGALNEVSELLQRMNELSVQSANGSLTPEDRGYIQLEINQLSNEINRIGSETTFNEIHIFDYDNEVNINESTTSHKGGATDTGYMTDAYQMGGKYYPSANIDLSGVNATTVDQLYGKSFSFTCSAGCAEAFKFTFIDGNGTQSSVVGQNNGQNLHEYTIDIHGLTSAKEVLDTLFDYVYDNYPNKTNGGTAPTSKTNMNVSHSNLLVRSGNNSFSIVGQPGYSTAEQAQAKYASKTGSYGKADCSELRDIMGSDEIIVNALVIQAGADAGQHIYLTMDKMNAKLLDVDPLDVSTQTAASASIDKVKAALNEISRQRAVSGAEQNRLEHAIYNLDNTTENTQAAESAIRDTDMAAEMVKYANQNILMQAGQAMLAQANQSNQGVLSLLQQ